MRGRPDDESDYDAPPPIDRFALARAVQGLRHLIHFHTSDVVRHHAMGSAHRDEDIESIEYRDRVEAMLEREALFMGVRGPLPGHPQLGLRWAWQVPEADITGGKGGDQGPDKPGHRRS